VDTIARDRIIEKALVYWSGDQAIETGKVIFETIPVNLRHRWAYEILKFAYAYFPNDARIDSVLEFANHPEIWGEGKGGRYMEAHRIVDKVNTRLESSLIFRLATQVGKIVYTAQQFPAPFDHSAGWEIAEILKQIVQQRNDQEFGTVAWSKLVDDKFIALEKPVMCHPVCPICRLNGLTPAYPFQIR